MHTITFYHLGNADICLVELESGEKLLTRRYKFGKGGYAIMLTG